MKNRFFTIAYTTLLLLLCSLILFSCDRTKKDERDDHGDNQTTNETTSDTAASQEEAYDQEAYEEAMAEYFDEFGKVRRRLISIMEQGTAYQCDIPLIIENNGDCGYIEVPKDYSDVSKGHFNMFWYKLSPENPVSDNIVVPLVGGPGASPKFGEIIQYLYTTEWSNIKDSFTILGFDYRGTGLSEPYHREVLRKCSENFHYLGGDNYPPQVDDCIAQIGSFIDDYKHISSRNIARDIETLLDAHQAEEAVLLGAYYGSRVALTALRDIPERVSATILDAAIPVEVNMITQSQEAIINNLQHLDQIVDSKKINTIFNFLKKHNNIDQLVFDVSNIAELAYFPDISELIDEYYDMVISNEENTDYEVTNSMSRIHGAILSEYPPNNLIYTNTHYHKLYELYGDAEIDLLFYRHTREFDYIIMMSEEYPFMKQQQSKAENTMLDPFIFSLANLKLDWILSTTDLDLWRALYEELADNNVISDIEMKPVNTDKPILMYGGMRDMRIPAQWAKQIMNNAPHSRLFLFHQYSHPVSTMSSCAIDIAIPFIKNPNAQTLEGISAEHCYDEEYTPNTR